MTNLFVERTPARLHVAVATALCFAAFAALFPAQQAVAAQPVASTQEPWTPLSDEQMAQLEGGVELATILVVTSVLVIAFCTGIVVGTLISDNQDPELWIEIDGEMIKVNGRVEDASGSPVCGYKRDAVSHAVSQPDTCIKDTDVETEIVDTAEEE